MTTVRKTGFALGLACIVMTVTAAMSAQKLNLNGTWRLNVPKSDFGSDTPPKSMTVMVALDEPKLQLGVAEVTHDDQQRRYALALTTDGKPVQNPGGTSSDSASWEGDTLVIEHNDPAFTLIRRITVSKDGQTAIGKNVYRDVNGKETSVTEIFDRQK